MVFVLKQDESMLFISHIQFVAALNSIIVSKYRQKMSGLADHVTCSVCMDLYSDPLALPCMHSFCRHCIERLHASCLTLKCPDCRQDVELGRNGIRDLPKNFQLSGIVESFKKENSSKTRGRSDGNGSQPLCPQHSMTCEILCETCSRHACPKCLTTANHSKHRLKILTKRGWSTERGDGSEPFCVEHDRQFRLHCQTCTELTCSECLLNNHGGHSLATLTDAFDNLSEHHNKAISRLDARIMLLRATQKTCRHLAQKTQTDAQRIKQELTSYFNRLRDVIEKRESQMRGEIDRREQDVVQKYMGKADEMSRKEKLIVDIMNRAQTLVTENNLNFVKKYSEQSQSIAQVLADEHLDGTPRVKGLDEVTLVTCSLEKELSSIAWRWTKDEVRPARKAPPVPNGNTTSPSEKTSPSNEKTTSSTTPSPKSRPPRPSPTPRVPREIFPNIQQNIHVTRGKDWRDGVTDGGPGHVGVVTSVQREVDRVTCSVRWPNGKTGTYIYGPPTTQEIKLV
ncbi:E3 ubiquitin-protein ligase Midline-1-like isoform X1 [Dreissena polymorpha]|nr:E3 ubiquitin-protein ligase Midline-1-like isoform X1 [Dreissena polymorpha]